jgi:ABC-2 type transport system permease protein
MFGGFATEHFFYLTFYPMRLFWELTNRSFQRYLTYRAATVAGLVTNLFFGLLRVALFLALYGEQQEVAGLSTVGIITYTGLTQAMIAYLSMFSWYDLMDSVHSGEIAADLLKPMNLFTFWLAQDFGRAAVNFLFRGVAFMLAYEIFFDLTYPTSPIQWLALALAILLSWLVSFAWRFLINLAAFWTPNARGIGRFAFVLSWFFSGFLMPLRFFPEWVVRLSALTPFPQMVNTVVEVYLGLLSGPALAWALTSQALWALGLITAGQLLMRAGVRRLVILGG